MKLLWLSYPISYVLLERIRYEIHKVVECSSQTIDFQGLSCLYNATN